MRKERFLQNGAALATLGAFIFAIPPVLGISEPVFVIRLLNYFGLIIGVLGIILCLLPFIPNFEYADPNIKKVKRNELRDAYNYCEGIFGGDFSSYNQVKEWFRHSKNIFWIVEKVKKKSNITVSEIAGFFSILPLNNDGYNFVIQGKLDGRHLYTEHLSEDFESAVALYIGVIASKGRKEQGQAIASLMTSISKIQETNACPILTRPTTKDGLRLAKRRGFEAIDGSGTKDLNKIYQYEGDPF